MTHSSCQWSYQPHQRTQCMHRRQKIWIAENQLKFNDDKTEALLFPFSSSLKPPTISLLTRLLLSLTTSPSLILPGTLDTFSSQNCPWKGTSWKYVKLLILSLNTLVQPVGFSLKTQPGHLLLPISSHDLTTATVSSWVHLILSSNLRRKF